ncbi:MAG: non-ribosomal peptide synthetase [Acetobacteraceae bacterium]
MIDAWLYLMRAAVEQPDARLDALPVAARHHQVANWPDLAPDSDCALADNPADMGALFEAILMRWPHAPAIVWPQGRLTFMQVAAIARAIASLAQSHGISPADTIAVRIAGDAPPGSSVLYLCAQVAAFSLGCAVMPLGQQVPAGQAWAQVERVQARFILSATDDPDGAPAWLHAVRPVRIAGFPHAGMFVRGASTDRPASCGSDHPAVILTSSGTTGTPKTSCLSQAMILGFVRGLVATGTFVPCPTLINANIGFDIILADVWVPWSHGQHLVVLETDRRTPAILAAATAMGAAFTSFSPSIAAALLDSDPHCLAPFRGVHVAGEALSLPLAKRLEALAPETRVVNGYGPSETAPLTTVWPVSTAAEATVPLGHALPGYRVLVADPHLRPLPAHWPGELLIASAAPALGYFDPEMSVGAFVEVTGQAPGPFFRSGDFGWIDSQGRAQFIGRRDRQVKIRGVRVELNGVEHRILTVSGVADAAVIATGIDTAASAVIAVVQPASRLPDGTLIERIMTECQAWLPRSAVPSRVILVDTIPKGPSGKKDYRQLAEQYRTAEPAGDGGTVPADGSVEARLATLWRDHFTALGRHYNAFHVEADMFAFGATSLDMLSMAERIETEFGVRIPDERILLSGTIGAQAEMIRMAPLPAPAIRRDRLTLRLLRPANSTEPSRGMILGLPGVNGAAGHMGVVAANALPMFDIWVMAVDLDDQDMLRHDTWLTVAHMAADRLLQRGGLRLRAMVGFSFGGFLGWLIGRILSESGRDATPIINLDGVIPDAAVPGWRQAAARWLMPDATCATPMLLLRRSALAPYVSPASTDAAWAELGVLLTARAVGTCCHMDLARAPAIRGQAEAMATFAEFGSCAPTADHAASPERTPGGVLFDYLRRREPVDPDAIRRLLAMLAPGPVDVELARGLMFLALLSGDAGLASSVIKRMAEASHGSSDVVYAQVALLAQMRQTEEAEACAAEWAARSGRAPQSLIARARRVLPRSINWNEASGLFGDRLDAALDFAASHIGRA